MYPSPKHFFVAYNYITTEKMDMFKWGPEKNGGGDISPLTIVPVEGHMIKFTYCKIKKVLIITFFTNVKTKGTSLCI